MAKTIQQQIDDLGPDRIKQIQDRFTVGDIVPYPYQCVAYAEIAKRLSMYEHPFYVKASVSAGKTIIIAMVSSQCKKMNLPMMVLARQAEIVQQDHDEIKAMGVPNSVYCAGLNTKSCYFPIVVGSEGTVAGGLFKALGDYVPAVIGIDECHQVDWMDLYEAIEGNETYEQMKTEKGEPMRDDNGILIVGSNGKYMLGTGRTQYTIIIVELMRRCREKYRRELRIFGLTGSEFRNVTPILVEDKRQPGFWRDQITNIDTNYLIEFGSVVTTIFGDNHGLKYDLSMFEAGSQDGVQDYSREELRAMEKKIRESSSMTQKIMQMVAVEAQKRNAVLITCAGKKHCEEAAAALPPGSTYAIITDDTTAKKRQAILQDVMQGKIKYTFQVMALTTGVNVPLWDFSVLLRKIGSLTLLIQLLGRGMRLLKKWHIEAGYHKQDHLVWDFAGTLDELGQLYFDPILEQAQYQNRNRTGKNPKHCEVCGSENSFYARRCIGQVIVDKIRILPGKISGAVKYGKFSPKKQRCEYFWSSKRCDDQYDEKTKVKLKEGCGAENDPAARECRVCGQTLIDPNLKLTGKMYTKNDWYDVVNFEVGLTRNQAGVIYTYTLRDRDGEMFRAYEKFFPESDQKVCHTIFKTKGILPHVADPKMVKYFLSCRSAKKVVGYAHHIMAPLRVTHRRNAKKEDIISRKDFDGKDD